MIEDNIDKNFLIENFGCNLPLLRQLVESQFTDPNDPKINIILTKVLYKSSV